MGLSKPITPSFPPAATELAASSSPGFRIAVPLSRTNTNLPRRKLTCQRDWRSCIARGTTKNFGRCGQLHPREAPAPIVLTAAGDLDSKGSEQECLASHDWVPRVMRASHSPSELLDTLDQISPASVPTVAAFCGPNVAPSQIEKTYAIRHGGSASQRMRSASRLLSLTNTPSPRCS